jgi:hypothetical protein
MKRIRRLSIEIEIEHREYSLTFRESSDENVHPGGSLEVPQSKNAWATPSCPTCGSPEMVPLDGGHARSIGELVRLARDLAGKEVHSILSGTDLWLCVLSVRKFLSNSSTHFRDGPEGEASLPSG